MYQHPLAYLLGIEGAALMRAFNGDFDRAFVEARFTEIRRLLDRDDLAGAGVDVEPVDTTDGYRVWSKTYDDGRNTAFDFDEPTVHEIVDALPAGVALDAACGTGRYAEYLVARSHQVVGVDGSPDMLARAKVRVPSADFRLGQLDRLPVADADVDLVVCALALTHIPSLVPAFTEFARVLRPGGHLVIADMHMESVMRGSVPRVRDAEGRPGRLPAFRHRTGDYLRAALGAGFQVRRCEEQFLNRDGDLDTPSQALGPVDDVELGPWDVWPWCLDAIVPQAATAANGASAATIIWHFELTP